jgi:hypothetical protein
MTIWRHQENGGYGVTFNIKYMFRRNVFGSTDFDCDVVTVVYWGTRQNVVGARST